MILASADAVPQKLDQEEAKDPDQGLAPMQAILQASRLANHKDRLSRPSFFYLWRQSTFKIE